MLRRSERLAALPPISYRETGVRRVFKKIHRKSHVSPGERVFESDFGMNDSIPCCTPTWTAPRRRQRKTLWMGLIFLAFLFGISLKFILSARLFAEKEKGNTVKTFLDLPVQEETAPVRQENEGVKKNLEQEMAVSLPQTPELDIPPDNTAEDINENCYIVQPNAYKEWSDDATKEDFPFKSLGAFVAKISKTLEPEALVCLMGFCWIYQRSPNVILQLLLLPFALALCTISWTLN
ncbi:uncharacterized protein LOC134293629 isoform X1 [Anolis carolinensis]|uniref:uncharacterized protein LOC134293629 isoform X1 n=1 Tax=Anolis carolinensis TaxID=28377 RepID=UPI002F2B2DBD